MTADKDVVRYVPKTFPLRVEVMLELMLDEFEEDDNETLPY